MVRSAVVLIGAVLVAGCAMPAKVREVVESPPARRGSPIVMPVAVAASENPFEAGRTAALELEKRMLSGPRAVVVSECFEDKARKRRVLRGVCSVFPEEIVFGGATYGSFDQSGCADRDAVGLLGIAGEGVFLAAALERGLGTAKLSAQEHQAEIEKRLRAAGARLAGKLPKRADSQLVILFADAHSPKNAPLVEGVQQIMGKQFPITGGSVNKNEGQTYVYFQGRMYEDSAMALLLAGDFHVAMAGRQAKDNEKVIATAKAAAAEALENVEGKPFAILAFDCAGRKGKLHNIEDELRAMQGVVGKHLPLFGCYCAGEIGPADVAEPRPGVLSSGVGWHLMFTILAR